MKTYNRRLLLIVAFAVFSLFLSFYLTQNAYKKLVSQNLIPQSQIANKAACQTVPNEASLGSPVRLMIPVIDVNASIQPVGVTQSGEMEVPSNTVDVGWFKLGSHPGEKGSAVVAGHIDGENGEKGVFANLYKLKDGDKLYVEDNKGVSIAFVVRESRMYNPGYADEVFSRNDNTYLNLVTCDGVWDGVKKSYNKRLVVFADLVH